MAADVPSKRGFRFGRFLLWALLAGVALYFLLLIPEPSPPPPAGAGQPPFLWNRDAFWSGLERQFADARAAGCEPLADRINSRLAEIEGLLAAIQRKPLAPEAEEFDRLETALFELAPLVAVCPGRLPDYTALVNRGRSLVKRQSERWDLQARAVRERLYRILYGARLALEEVMLQAPAGAPFAELTLVDDEPSQTPSFQAAGLKLRSGDILVSRGGAPTSALIARGNDFPGSFSHAALLHVDEQSGKATVIESHIECGVAVGSFENYLQDKKLRILVLRLRADLPAMKADPLLPHAAATAALREAERRHIPYDFAMDYRDPEKQFCSEVVAVAYAGRNVHLWLGPTFISHPVVTAWLASVGVRHFETQEPADLEYDPQLRVIAEWRDRSALLKAHADDAVMDVMLERGVAGEELRYQRWLLPLARISKGYSVLLNWIGKVGPVPEGMSATQALRASKFQSDHEIMAARVLAQVDRFRAQKGYAPPYWELVKLAEAGMGKAGKDQGE